MAGIKDILSRCSTILINLCIVFARNIDRRKNTDDTCGYGGNNAQRTYQLKYLLNV